MDCETIRFEIGDDHVATVTLDRPESLNAFDDQMGEELAWAWETIRDTDAVHAVVLRSSSERAFCTGRDFKAGAGWYQSSDNVWNRIDPGTAISPKQHHKVWKPVVVAVNGMCAGGGEYFLNEADIIICSEDATFFDPHANIGIVSALEPIGMLKRGVPMGEVMRWALMGTEERITAETALRIGLTTEIVPYAELHARAHEIAASIAARSPIAIQGSVRAIWESTDMTRSTALQNGMLYTQLGNPPLEEWGQRKNQPPTFR
jgi:E-phenylitaconyl-CoA hydratase